MPVRLGPIELNRPYLQTALQTTRSALKSDLLKFAMIFEFLAQAAPAAPAPASGPTGGIGFFVPFIFIFIIMYFMLFRPQKKRQQEQQRLISALKTGDKVVTNAGIHGLIANVKDTTVMLKVADNVKIEVEKSAVSNVLKES